MKRSIALLAAAAASLTFGTVVIAGPNGPDVSWKNTPVASSWMPGPVDGARW